MYIKHLSETFSGPSESGFKVFEEWEVKKICLHFYPRSEKWKCLAFTLFREVESESFCFHSFSKSEKLNENDLRSRKEVSREYSRNLKKRDLFWFFWLPTLAQNMVWININFMSPQHSKNLENSRETRFSLGTEHSEYLSN